MITNHSVTRLAVLAVGLTALMGCLGPIESSGSPTPTSNQTDSTVKAEPRPSKPTVRPRVSEPELSAAPESTVAPEPQADDGFDAEADRPRVFETRPPGSELPSSETCAKWVRSVPETVPENRPYNAREGHSVVGDTYLSKNIEAEEIEARIDGDFTGTTDEIIQWGACKWGFDEHYLRAQAYAESTWFAGKLGDCGESALPETGGEGGCASLGLLQVRGANIDPVFPGVWPMAWKSTSFNVDYALAVRRACFEGDEVWLKKTSSDRKPYRSGDEWGCMGRWYSGKWYDSGAKAYIERVRTHSKAESWKKHVGCPDWKKRFYCGDISRKVK